MCTFPPSASSAPLRESILQAEAQRTQRLCTQIKAVRVVRRRETSSAKFTGEPEMLGLAVDLWLNLPSICPPGAMVRSSSVLSRGNHYRSKGRNPW